MEVKELRIGNLITGSGGEIETVVGIVDNSILTEYNQSSNTWLPYTNFVGIELTPEILEKCGFVKEDMADMGIQIYMPISITDDTCLSWSDGTIWIGEHNTKIKYLHQLQNLYFALTSAQLTIKM